MEMSTARADLNPQPDKPRPVIPAGKLTRAEHARLALPPLPLSPVILYIFIHSMPCNWKTFHCLPQLASLFWIPNKTSPPIPQEVCPA